MTAENAPVGFKIAVGIWFFVFWAFVLWRCRQRNLRGDPPGRTVSGGSATALYFLMIIYPAIDYLNARMALRHRERIRAFLKLADDLWVRQQRVDSRLPRRPGS